MITEHDTRTSAAERRLSIGLFAQLTNLTHKALKTYERYGILQPAHVDPETRYRFYSLQQVRTAETIRLLRTVGVPLRDIAAALRDEETTPLATLLVLRREHLAAELAATERLLDHLGGVTADSCTGLSTDVVLREVAAHCALVCAAQCTFDTHEVTVDRLLERLARLTGTLGLAPGRRETATYFTDLDFTHDYRVEVSVPVHAPCDRPEAFPPSCRHVPATTVATAVHRGPYREMSTTAACLVSWVAEHDLPLAGRFSETYLVDERDTDDPDAYRTAIGLAIAAA